MPELPEVQIMSENLARWATGKTIRSVRLHDAALLQMGGPQDLVGCQVGGVHRRAKYTIVDAGDRTLVLHYRMTGKAVRLPAEGRIRLELELDDGTHLGFKDQRRLGQAWILETADLDGFFETRGLGPEPWPQRQTGAWWAARFVGLRGNIKPALLQQERIAGIGNILASEICFLAGIDPRRSVAALDPADWQRIAQHAPDFIDTVLEAERGDEITLVEEGGRGPFAVYGRENEACPGCQSPVQRLVQSGRSTFWCATCQR